MTDAQYALLVSCKPEVTLQAFIPPLWMSDRGKVMERSNTHYAVAQDCIDMGWLEFVRDQEPHQTVYRITPAGSDALDMQSHTKSKR